jgi:replication factor C small subunit
VHQDIKKVIDIPFNVSSNSTDSKGLCSYYNNKALKLFLEFLGATPGNKTIVSRRVPELTDYKMFFKGYLQGFYDADGKSIKVLNDDISISPVLLTQSIASESQLSLFADISRLANRHFGIELDYKVVKSYESTFGGTDQEMHLYNGKSNQILKFLGAIGHYYDKANNVDVYGYLKYKQSIKGHPQKFSKWKDQYFGHGIVNDVVVSIEENNKQVKVYDCCFETNHWYVTNGLMSHNCNYPNKVIPAIHSRCQGFHIANLDKTEYTARMAEILITEGVEFDLETLDTFVKTTYPDMRKCINLCQQNVKNSSLQAPSADDGATESDYQLMMVALFKEKRYKEARDLVCKQVAPEEYEDLFRFMYKNLEFWAEGDENKEDQCILVIRNGLVKHVSCADAEINACATMIELEMIAGS